MNVSEQAEEKKVLKTLGEQIGKRRSELSLTQEKLSKKIGMDRGNYTKIENGKEGRKLRFSQLIKLSKELNASMDYIFGLTDEPSNDIKVKEIYKKYGLESKTLKEIEEMKNDGNINAINELFIHKSSFIQSFVEKYELLKIESTIFELLTAFTMVEYEILLKDNINENDKKDVIRGYRRLLKKYYDKFKLSIEGSTVYKVPTFDGFDIYFDKLLKCFNEKNIDNLKQLLLKIRNTIVDDTRNIEQHLYDSLNADLTEIKYDNYIIEDKLFNQLKKEGEMNERKRNRKK